MDIFHEIDFKTTTREIYKKAGVVGVVAITVMVLNVAGIILQTLVELVNENDRN